MQIPSILIITWKREASVLKIISILRELQIRNLYIYSDGYREWKEGEREIVENTRKSIQMSIDWMCNVKYKFCEVNQGCALAINNAIDWFFNNVDEGIILEDDCIPNSMFFSFCTEMLIKYRHNSKIMHINAVSYFSKEENKSGKYFHSKYAHVWGWATWKRAWLKNNLVITDNNEQIQSNISHLCTRNEQQYWLNIFRNQRDNPIDTWDYSWVYSIWKERGICIYPLFTMVENVGFDIYATHTTTRKSVPVININVIAKNDIYRRVCINLIENYYDYISFNNAFKRKNMKIWKMRYFLSFIKQYNKIIS